MARYSKLTSNYVLRKRHQNTNDGTIFERDWGTLGERNVIETGKRKIYGDSGFIFTDSTRKGIRKRNNTGEWSDAFTLENLSPAVNSSVNQIELSDSNDIRDYAYWGSAEDLLRGAVENIVKWFPGRLWSTNEGISRINPTESNYEFIQDIIGDGHNNYYVSFIDEKLVDTPCECVNFDEQPCIDFGCAGDGEDCLQFDCKENNYREDCCVQFNDRLTELRGKDCVNFGCDGDCNEFADDCDHSIHIFVVKNPFQINLFDKNQIFGKYDNQMRNLAVSWKQYLANGSLIKSYKIWIKPYDECDPDYTVRYAITIRFDDREAVFYGLKIGKDILWCCDTPNLSIQPKDRLIEKYFRELDGIEKVLLSRKTNPWYTAKFLTPVKNKNEQYIYVEKLYRWPSTDYAIDVDTYGFNSYVANLANLGQLMDELWCDNIWGNMTHEAIKNFDWTYTREYEDGEEEDNILGGTRMEHLLKITGAHFDGIKRYVDGIRKKVNVNRNDMNNMPNAEMSDKASLIGWEPTSTKGSDTANLSINWTTFNYVNKKPSRWQGTALNHEKWYPNTDATKITENDNDNYFMRNLILNSAEIFRTKGTSHAIEMVMGMFGFGDNDFEIKEKYYTVTPKLAEAPLYYYSYVMDPVSISEYTLINNVSNLEQYIEGKNYIITETDPEKIRFTTDNISVCYEKKHMDYIDAVQFAAISKDIERKYENNPYSGTPINDIWINNEHYIVPYFSQELIYDGDVQFETNGGWGKLMKLGDNVYEIAEKQYDYLESVIYIDTLQNCKELTNVNMFDIGDKKVFYVIDLSDYAECNSDIPQDGNLSHYFKLVDKYNPQNFGSWRNIPLMVPTSTGFITVKEAYENNKSAFSDYCNNNTAFEGITYDDYLLAVYYDNVVPDNIGNNPHCGFGKYDLGNEYYEHLIQPFTYPLKNYSFSNSEAENIAKLIRFNVGINNGEKMINTISNPTENYYMPSKLLIFKNNINNDRYREYFKKIILKYLLQVIPSTTILILENF